MNELKEEMTIRIYRSSNDNLFYWEIYDTLFSEDEEDALADGICTTDDMKIALQQATDKAQELLAITK